MAIRGYGELSDLEYWRRRLVVLVEQRGSFTHADVLRVSRILDESVINAQHTVALDDAKAALRSGD